MKINPKKFVEKKKLKKLVEKYISKNVSKKKLEEFENEYENDIGTEHRENKYFDEEKIKEVKTNIEKHPTPTKITRKCMEKAKRICGQNLECTHDELRKCIYFKSRRKRISRERHDSCRQRAFNECGVRESGEECRLIFYKHCIKNSHPAK